MSVRSRRPGTAAVSVDAPQWPKSISEAAFTQTTRLSPSAVMVPSVYCGKSARPLTGNRAWAPQRSRASMVRVRACQVIQPLAIATRRSTSARSSGAWSAQRAVTARCRKVMA